jgi:hypothetical protein
VLETKEQAPCNISTDVTESKTHPFGH